MVKLEPSDPFEPEIFTLRKGTALYRVYSNTRKSAAESNPGFGAPTRFAFFGNPKIPVLYAAETEEAAVCETILHEVPPGPGNVMFDDIKDKVCAQITPNHDLKLVALMGDGLRKLGPEAKYVTGTLPTEYGRTVLWAVAAHTAGFDGLVWMSNRRNTDRAYVLFGDRVKETALDAVQGTGHLYAAGPGFDWLVEYLAKVDIDVLMV